jgi:hypothetical protein
MIAVDTTLGHDGSNSIYGIVDSSHIYARAARAIPYGGDGFSFSAWFYVNLSETPYFNNNTQAFQGTSEWAGVLNVSTSNRAALDNLSYSCTVGYNNRTANQGLGYEIGPNIYRYFDTLNTSGWYEGTITYDGNNMTFADYDSAGNLLGSYAYSDPGFIPGSMIVNAGSTSHRISDITYTTW